MAATTRYATVSGLNITDERVAPYLPGNYRVVGSHHGRVLIAGEDTAGWTLHDYVIPRLASGLYAAVELVELTDPSGFGTWETDGFRIELRAAVDEWRMASDGPSDDDEHEAAAALAAVVETWLETDR
jgi:hypothetical protein